MLIALNGATTMKADLEHDVVAASLAGFDGIELWASKLRQFLSVRSIEALDELLSQHRVRAFSINSIERITFRDSSGSNQLLQECAELSRIAAAVGCPYLVVVPSPLPPATDRESVIKETVRALKEMGAVAEFFGASLAFEFLGQTGCSVQTLQMASEIVDQVDRENVGLVIDTFHFYSGGSRLDDIRRLNVDKLFIFHLNDAENRPRSELQDSHRLLPGMGILPLSDIVRELKSIGYDGIASVEIFRPEYWDMDANELARQARSAALKVLGA
jgi:2-keto-myo-inositol isomerase